MMGIADEKLRFGVTDAGRVVLRGTGFVALAALIVPAFGVLSTLVSILLAALLIGFVLRPRVRLDGRLPDRIVAGRQARCTYVLRNVGRLPVYGLCVRLAALPEGIEEVGEGCIVPRLAPGEQAEVTVTLRAKRRGLYSVPRPTCRSAFPFNLFWFGASRRGQEDLVVLPAFCRLDLPVRGTARHAHSTGVRLAGWAGGSPEYVGSRPFRPGDSPRRIDARAWARLAAPATKEYDQDVDNNALLVLDTRVPPDAWKTRKEKEIKELEAAVSLCASVAFTLGDDCFIDLLLAGPDMHVFTAWPGPVRLDRIHDLLAAVEPSQGDLPQETVLALADRFRETSHAVFILLNWSRTWRQLAELAQRAGCRATVVLIDEANGLHAGPEEENWIDNVRFLPPDEILAQRVKTL